jgi:GAF domain-containing protein
MNNTPESSADPDGPDPMRAFAELALIVVGAQPAEQTLRRVAELAKQTLPGVEDVSLTVVENGHPRSVVFTGRLAVDLDERQYELGFGPCLDAAETGQTIIVASDDDNSPYREFGRVAGRAGVQHTVSVGLPLAQATIGGLNIYSINAAPFSTGLVEHAEVFAGYAAVAVANVTSHAAVTHQAMHLQVAMESRAVIEQAKGIIMVRDRCSADDAFDMLRRISQQQNVKLRDLARAIVDGIQK